MGRIFKSELMRRPLNCQFCEALFADDRRRWDHMREIHAEELKRQIDIGVLNRLFSLPDTRE